MRALGGEPVGRSRIAPLVAWVTSIGLHGGLAIAVIAFAATAAHFASKPAPPPALVMDFQQPVYAPTTTIGGAAPAARPRVRVAANNVEEIDIRDCLTKAVEATNAENLDDFCSCFTAPTRSRLRKQVAMRFVEHDVTMELLDTQVIAVGKTSGEVAVKYRLVLTDDRFDVVSLVAVKQEHGYWRISSEKIQSYEHQSPVQCSPSRYACLGAACRVAAR